MTTPTTTPDTATATMLMSPGEFLRTQTVPYLEDTAATHGLKIVYTGAPMDGPNFTVHQARLAVTHPDYQVAIWQGSLEETQTFLYGCG